MTYSMQANAVWWGLGVGLAFFAVLYVAVLSGWFRKATYDVVPAEDITPEPTEPLHHYPEGLAEAHGKVPVVLKLVIASFIVFLVVYVALYINAMNGPLRAFDAFLTT
jgi:hypothetical protein